MHPVDDVVTDVHRVGIRRQNTHLKRVAKARGLKRLIPPTRALDQSILNRLWRSVIDVVYDRFDGIADRC